VKLKHFSLWVLLLFFGTCCTPSATIAEQPGSGHEGSKRLLANTLKGPIMEVHFIDVGQGDAILIKTPEDKNYLIDAGPTSARKTLIPYLKYVRVKRIEAILISHSHLDHTGAMLALLDAFEVGAVYSSGYFHPARHNKKVLDKIEALKIKFREVRRGEELKLDHKIVLSFLHPPKKWEAGRADPNDFSVATRLSFGDIDFLLPGDAEKKAEKEMLKGGVVLRSEFLKLGHHGSETATTDPFLEAVSPLYAIISCGVDNKFKHPHDPTLQKLKARNITIMRTDEHGTIGVYTNGKRIMIKLKGKTPEPVSLLLRIVQPDGQRLLFATIDIGGLHVG
jgi:beta-lactamase superfamily II metal-dependent hydrolase